MQDLIVSTRKISKIVLSLVILFGSMTLLLLLYETMTNFTQDHNTGLFHEDIDVIIENEDNVVEDEMVEGGLVEEDALGLELEEEDFETAADGGETEDQDESIITLNELIRKQFNEI